MGEPEKKDAEESRRSRPEAGPAGRAQGAPPEAAFLTLVASLAGQATIHMGLVEHPVLRKVQKDLRQARYVIDLLGVLEKKTRGNLDEEERSVLDRLLTDLRLRYLASTGGGGNPLPPPPPPGASK